MNSRFVLAAALAVIWSSASANPADRLTFPQKRAATDDEVRAYQSLGKVVVSSDGAVMLFEWQQPYRWSPDNSRLPPVVAVRKQTFIFKVDLTAAEPNAEYLFYPAAGATYFLGDLSADGKTVSFYELDRDDNTVRSGSVGTNEGPSPKIALSNSAVDLAALARARAPSLSGGTDSDAGLLPKNAKPIARSGEVTVYCVDTPDTLSVLFKKGDRVTTVFENDRRPQAVVMSERKMEFEKRYRAEQTAVKVSTN